MFSKAFFVLSVFLAASCCVQGQFLRGREGRGLEDNAGFVAEMEGRRLGNSNNDLFADSVFLEGALEMQQRRLSSMLRPELKTALVVYDDESSGEAHGRRLRKKKGKQRSRKPAPRRRAPKRAPRKRAPKRAPKRKPRRSDDARFRARLDRAGSRAEVPRRKQRREGTRETLSARRASRSGVG